MTIESALTYFLAIFVFAVKPGPGIFALLAKGVSAGTRPCIPLALGMTVSDVIYRSHRAKSERYVSGGGLNASSSVSPLFHRWCCNCLNSVENFSAINEIGGFPAGIMLLPLTP